MREPKKRTASTSAMLDLRVLAAAAPLLRAGRERGPSDT